MSKTPKGLK